MRQAPVWAWIGDEAAPQRVGTLFRDEASGAGAFQYDEAYLKAGGRALDPGELRHRDARHPKKIKAADREGVPGIIADAGPDTWGRRVLAQDLGFEPNAMDALEFSADDGAGNLVVGDLARKPPLELLDLEVLAEAISRRQDGLPYEPNKMVDQVLSPDTALGGAKPKATTLIEGVPWIAKFPEKGDPYNLPYYEAAALRVAARLGIEAADVSVHPLPQGRSVLLVKRFDRLPGGGRLPLASGLTVLGSAAQGVGPARRYLKLAQELSSWTRETSPYRSKAQLWDRIVFNGLVGNIDDHPRNHALIMREGRWQLSPLFDVVPTYIPRTQVALAMPFLAESATRVSAMVSANNLVRAAPSYGLLPEKALARLIELAEGVLYHWPEVLADLGTPAAVTEETRPAIDWARHVLKEAQALTLEDIAPPKAKRQSWRWQP